MRREPIRAGDEEGGKTVVPVRSTGGKYAVSLVETPGVRLFNEGGRPGLSTEVSAARTAGAEVEGSGSSAVLIAERGAFPAQCRQSSPLAASSQVEQSWEATAAGGVAMTKGPNTVVVFLLCHSFEYRFFLIVFLGCLLTFVLSRLSSDHV